MCYPAFCVHFVFSEVLSPFFTNSSFVLVVFSTEVTLTIRLVPFAGYLGLVDSKTRNNVVSCSMLGLNSVSFEARWEWKVTRVVWPQGFCRMIKNRHMSRAITK